MGFYLEKIMNDVNKQVNITIPNPDGASTVVTGILMQDINFSGGSQWNTPDAGAKTEGLNNAINSASQLANLLPGFNLSQQRVVSPSDTVVTWVGAERPKFNIDMAFIAIYGDQDIREKVAQVTRASYPTKSLGGVRLTAPGNYNVDVAGNAENTCIVQIGRWFKATNMVIEGVNTVFSKSILKNGAPIKADVNVSMTPANIPDQEELGAYFIALNN